MPAKSTKTARPKPGSALEHLLSILDLEPLEENLFRGRSPQQGWQRVYGGQVLGQALVAAVRTVPADRIAHSLHAYFLLGGEPAVGFEADEHGIGVDLARGPSPRTLRAALLVAADGRASPLRQAAGIGVVRWSYAQAGIVTTVRLEQPHQGRERAICDKGNGIDRRERPLRHRHRRWRHRGAGARQRSCRRARPRYAHRCCRSLSARGSRGDA